MPGLRRIRSERLSAAESLLVEHVKGSYPVGLTGRFRPLYEFVVEGVPLILRWNTVGVGRDDEWKIRLSRSQAVVWSPEGTFLAEARRVSAESDRWAVSDGLRSFEVTVDKAKEKIRSVSTPTRWTRKLTHVLRVLPVGGLGQSVDTVQMTYKKTARRSGGLSISTEFTGVFEAEMDFLNPVPVPIAVLMLRLTLGQWALWAPRTGTWVADGGGAGG